MTEHILVGLTAILVIGTAAQWIAWRVRLPSILLLLSAGFVAGPISGFLDPDELLGELLLPVVSLSVAVILFEGGLSLKFAEFRKVGTVVTNLVTAGLLVTWVIGSAAGVVFLGFDIRLATLLGAILVVSGPTVIGPLLRSIRPSGKTGVILKWEGIVIDPIGAMLAVLVFEATLTEGFGQATTRTVIGLANTVLVGTGAGALAAFVMLLLLRRFWIPDALQNPIALALLVASFTVANELQTESGLLAATVMGVVLANQQTVSVRHIIEFKETLRVLLISGVFVLLAARIELSELAALGWRGAAFLGVLILVARPAAVAVSTFRSGLTFAERTFLAAMAPRGIVAAAVSAVFAIRLTEEGYEGAPAIVSAAFVVIVGTVLIYGFGAPWLAIRLGLAKPNPQGVLLVGAYAWAREMARALRDEGIDVLLADTNWGNISRARMAGLPSFYGSVLSESVLDHIELHGIGRLLAVTSNDEINSLAAVQFAGLFGRREVYQLAAERGRDDGEPLDLRGRLAFDRNVTFQRLTLSATQGWTIKVTRLTREYTWDDFIARYGRQVLPLFVIQGGDLSIVAADGRANYRPGQTLISFVPPPRGEPAPARAADAPRADVGGEEPEATPISDDELTAVPKPSTAEEYG